MKKPVKLIKPIKPLPPIVPDRTIREQIQINLFNCCCGKPYKAHDLDNIDYDCDMKCKKLRLYEILSKLPIGVAREDVELEPFYFFGGDDYIISGITIWFPLCGNLLEKKINQYNLNLEIFNKDMDTFNVLNAQYESDLIIFKSKLQKYKIWKQEQKLKAMKDKI